VLTYRVTSGWAPKGFPTNQGILANETRQLGLVDREPVVLIQMTGAAVAEKPC